MAEIKIKKKTTIWPWILAILAVLVILFIMFFANDDDDGTDDVSDDTSEMVTDDVNQSMDNSTYVISDTAISEISEYTTFVNKDAEMGLEHEYANAALNKLIEATESIANSLNVNISSDLETARKNAESITDDPLDLTHADKIKNAGSIVVDALRNIQSQRFPNMETEVGEVHDALVAIIPGEKTLEQTATVKNFFNEAGQLLTNMKNK